MTRHITPALLQMKVRLSHEGRTILEIAATTVVSQGAISEDSERAQEDQRHRGHHQEEDRDFLILLRIVRYNRPHPSPG